MLAKSVCILFSGKAGVGKTTSADMIKEYLSKFPYDAFIGSFATGVKSTAKCFGWDGKKDDRGRKLLQMVGQVGRAYDKDLWAKQLLEQIIPTKQGYPFDFVLVDDWRFPNEVLFVSENPLYSVYTARIYAENREILKGTPAYEDISEISLDSGFTFDYVINNMGTKDELLSQLVSIVNDILLREVYFGEKTNV